MSPAPCSLDASACALLSEDYPGTTRWHFQKELVACHSRACLPGLGVAGARGSGLASTQQQVALITGTGGRAGVALHPTGEAQALQQALDEVQPSGESNLVASLKLSLVRQVGGWLGCMWVECTGFAVCWSRLLSRSVSCCVDGILAPGCMSMLGISIQLCPAASLLCTTSPTPHLRGAPGPAAGEPALPGGQHPRDRLCCQPGRSSQPGSRGL